MKRFLMTVILLSFLYLAMMTAAASADILTIPFGTKVIGDEAFYGDTSLDQVLLPEGIESIGERAFANSTLTQIYLPKSLKKIENDAFDTNSTIKIIAKEGTFAYQWASGKGFDITPPDPYAEKFEYAYLSDGTCAVKGYKETPSGDLIIPAISSDGRKVTAIGDGAFDGCTGFTGKLVIPDDVTTIGNDAFFGCEGLTGNLIIPDGVTTIGSYAFCDCFGFSGNLTFPDSIKNIGDGAFYGCDGFTGNLIIPDALTDIGDSMFAGCTGFSGTLVIPGNVTSIGANAFLACDGFTGSLVIPDSVTSVGNSAFFTASGIQQLTLSKNLKVIEDYAFAYMGITDVFLPSSLTFIGDNAFLSNDEISIRADIGTYAYRWALSRRYIMPTVEEKEFSKYVSNGDGTCTEWVDSTTVPRTYIYTNKSPSGLAVSMRIYYTPLEDGTCRINQITYLTQTKHLDLPGYAPDNSVISEIGSVLFLDGIGDCIETIHVPEGVKKIGHLGTPNLTAIDLPESLEVINNTFSGCTKLTEINIPYNVNRIESDAFMDCSSLKSVEIPWGVPSIGYSAFMNCTSLTNVYIPLTVGYIADHAFYGCSSLEQINDLGGVSWIGTSAFEGCSKLKSIAFGWSEVSFGTSCFIYEQAFKDCYQLANIELPECVLEVRAGAFQNCKALTSLRFPYRSTIGGDLFPGCTQLNRIYCVKNSSPWQTFTNQGYRSKLMPTYEPWNGYISSATIDVYQSPYCATVFKNITLAAPAVYVVDHKNGRYNVEVYESRYRRYENVWVDESLVVKSPPASDVNDFVFEDNGDGTCTAVEYIGSKTHVVIPQYSPDGLRVTVIGNGMEGFLNQTWRNVKSVVVPEGVKEICRYSFHWYYNYSGDEPYILEQISLPSTLEKIGDFAFDECTRLKDIKLPAGLKEIGVYAFENTALTALIIPAGVEKIGTENIPYNFTGMPSLSKIIVDENNRYFKSIDGVLVEKGTNTIIRFPQARGGSYCIPDSISAIGNRAFDGAGISEVTIPGNVKTVGENAFGNAKIKKLNLQEGVKELKYNAFVNCSALTEIIMPDSIISLGRHVFGNCTNVTTLKISKNVRTIEESTFYGLRSIKNIVIPYGVRTIKSYAFSGCDKLESIYFPATVVEIIHESSWGHPFIDLDDTPDLKIYCIKGTKAWDWFSENGYADNLYAWNGHDYISDHADAYESWWNQNVALVYSQYVDQSSDFNTATNTYTLKEMHDLALMKREEDLENGSFENFFSRWHYRYVMEGNYWLLDDDARLRLALLNLGKMLSEDEAKKDLIVQPDLENVSLTALVSQEKEIRDNKITRIEDAAVWAVSGCKLAIEAWAFRNNETGDVPTELKGKYELGKLFCEIFVDAAKKFTDSAVSVIRETAAQEDVGLLLDAYADEYANALSQTEADYVEYIRDTFFGKNKLFEYQNDDVYTRAVRTYVQAFTESTLDHNQLKKIARDTILEGTGYTYEEVEALSDDFYEDWSSKFDTRFWMEQFVAFCKTTATKTLKKILPLKNILPSEELEKQINDLLNKLISIHVDENNNLIYSVDVDGFIEEVSKIVQKDTAAVTLMILDALRREVAERELPDAAVGIMDGILGKGKYNNYISKGLWKELNEKIKVVDTIWKIVENGVHFVIRSVYIINDLTELADLGDNKVIYDTYGCSLIDAFSMRLNMRAKGQILTGMNGEHFATWSAEKKEEQRQGLISLLNIDEYILTTYKNMKTINAAAGNPFNKEHQWVSDDDIEYRLNLVRNIRKKIKDVPANCAIYE